MPVWMQGVTVRSIYTTPTAVCCPFSNQMAGALQDELRLARSLSVSPILAGSSKFEGIVSSGETLKWAISTSGELRFIPAVKRGTEISHAVIHNGKDVIAAGESSIVRQW